MARSVIMVVVIVTRWSKEGVDKVGGYGTD